MKAAVGRGETVGLTSVHSDNRRLHREYITHVLCILAYMYDTCTVAMETSASAMIYSLIRISKFVAL